MRHEGQQQDDKMTRGNTSRNEILKGMSLCLSGFTDYDKKSKLCLLIKELGGDFTPELMTTRTTHLIMADDHGPATEKYNEAEKTSSIEILHYKWLEMCSLESRLLPTREFKVTLTSNQLDRRNEVADPSTTNTTENLNSYRLKLNSDQHLSPYPLFSSCTFFFVGFDEGAVASKSCTIGEATVSSSLYYLQDLVRTYMGTISWSLNENNISHIIVRHECCQNTELRAALVTYCSYNPNSPVSVTPDWILSCVKQKRLLNPQAFSLDHVTIQKKKNPNRSPQKKQSIPIHSKKINIVSNIFKGAAFHIVAVSSQPGTVQFNLTQMQELILTHGGTLLSTDLVNLRQKEIKHLKEPDISSRVCFVVNISGEFLYNQVVHGDPLLSQVKRMSLYQITPVTPIWIQVCISENDQVNAEIFPLLFQPQPWAIRLIPESILRRPSKDGKRGSGVSVSVSGFHSHERSGIQHLLLSIGAKYTENLPVQNTHLICHPNSHNGAKALRAFEWGLHVVTVDWLFHIIKFGFHGENNEEGGCEHHFLLNNPSKAIAAHGDADKKLQLSGSEEVVTHESGRSSIEENSSTNTSKVFNDIACPVEQIDIGGGKTRKRRNLLLETQNIKETKNKSHEYEDEDAIQNFQSESNKRIWQKANMADGDESQAIWWGNSNFG